MALITVVFYSHNLDIPIFHQFLLCLEKNFGQAKNQGNYTFLPRRRALNILFLHKFSLWIIKMLDQNTIPQNEKFVETTPLKKFQSEVWNSFCENLLWLLLMLQQPPLLLQSKEKFLKRDWSIIWAAYGCTLLK